MKNLLLTIIVFVISLSQGMAQSTRVQSDFVIVIHGGAGNISPQNINGEIEQQYRKALDSALSIGSKILVNGGTALDAVEKIINFMEDCPLFNAGKGAVYTADGVAELDASIMDGSNLKAGSVAGLRHIKNPISLARTVMEKSEHVMMVGRGAELFAQKQGFDWVDTTYFYTKKSWDAYQKAKKSQPAPLKTNLPDKHGTVGVVVLDNNGNLAAGTSTGGMMMKKFGRVGDSPIIGAGTYANNKTCAVSCTGHGEYFIRNVVAYDLSAMMEYGNISLNDAAKKIIHEKLKTQGGEGGLIAVDAKGNIAMEFNSKGMFRGYVKQNGEKKVFLFIDK
ncbi:MAG: isoaspartyl peptidase/L-asparaginase [Bacteroidota bacterium]